MLEFNIRLAESYKSESQRIRVMSEDWVKNYIFCPNCGALMYKYANGIPVGDFYCKNCTEDYELKSKKNNNSKIVDGAYRTMIERLKSDINPNFFFLNYNDYKVTNFIVIPKHFFIPDIIEERPPLSERSRRANWVGCNILLKRIPDSGKIYYVKEFNNRAERKYFKIVEKNVIP